jgi:hypothetical protein
VHRMVATTPPVVTRPEEAVTKLGRPDGTYISSSTFSPLKRWAKLDGPSGAGIFAPSPPL